MALPKYVTSVFDWSHFQTYLAGPIDFDRNGGKLWCDEWSERLVSLGISASKILNPCKKPLPQGMFEFNLDNEGELMNKYRSMKEWDQLCSLMSQIVHVDLRMVEKCDLVLANFPKYGVDPIRHLKHQFNSAEHVDKIAKEAFEELASKYASLQVHTYGTIQEIVLARSLHKPVMIVWEGGKENCAAWMMYLVGQHNVFSTFDDLENALKNIATGKSAYNAKDWLLFDFGS